MSACRGAGLTVSARPAVAWFPAPLGGAAECRRAPHPPAAHAQVQFLRDSWQPTVKKGVLQAIVHASDGWRRDAPRPSVYEQAETLELGVLPREDADDPDHGSRPRRMTRLVNLMASDTLRIVTNASLDAYADFVCGRAAARSFVPDPETFPDPPPLFVLDLISHGDELFLSTSAEFYASVPARLVDEAVQALAGLLPLDPFDLSFGASPGDVHALPTVGIGEPQVAACKARLTEALTASTEPLAEYLADFAKYLPFIQLDARAHVKDFAAASKPAEERPDLKAMEAKVLEHLATKERLEKEVPQHVSALLQPRMSFPASRESRRRLAWSPAALVSAADVADASTLCPCAHSRPLPLHGLAAAQNAARR